MILASSLLCSSRSSGVSSTGSQKESKDSAVGALTLAIVSDDDRDLSAVHIDDGLDRGGQFTIRGRKKMMSRIDDGELVT
jgi:hypothetical protein